MRQQKRIALYFLTVVTLTSSALTACKTIKRDDSEINAVQDGKKPLMLDVNDLSVLFGGTYDQPNPSLNPEPFITKGVFTEVMTAALQAKSAQNGFHLRPLDVTKGLEKWLITSFRFDPCAPSPALAFQPVPEFMKPSVPGCIVQLRLIATPFFTTEENDEKFSQAVDISLHLVFDLGVAPKSKNGIELKKNFAPFNSAIQGLQDIKRASIAAGANTDGKVLSTHPGLSQEAESTQKKVGEAVKVYLRKFATKDNLAAIALHGISKEDDKAWVFLSGVVKKGADGNPHFTLKKNPGFHKSDVMLMTAHELKIEPAGEDNTRSLGALMTNSKPTPAQKKAFYEVDHPFRTNVFNTDCVSCHQSTFAIRMSGAKSADASDRYLIPQGISGYFDINAPRGLSSYIHPDFARFGGESQIHSRVVTETAAATDLVNHILGGDNYENPGLDCGNDKKKLNAIWDCSIEMQGGTANWRDCYETCKIKGQ